MGPLSLGNNIFRPSPPSVKFFLLYSYILRTGSLSYDILKLGNFSEIQENQKTYQGILSNCWVGNPENIHQKAWRPIGDHYIMVEVELLM